MSQPKLDPTIIISDGRAVHSPSPESIRTVSSSGATISAEPGEALLETGRQPPDLEHTRARFLHALHSISLEIMNRAELDVLLQQVSDQVLLLMRASSCSIAMQHESGEYLEQVTQAGQTQTSKGRRYYRGEGVTGKSWSSAEILFADDNGKLSNRVQIGESAVRSIGMPIICEGEVAGVIGIDYFEINPQIAQCMDLVEQLSRLCSIAIEKARLVERSCQDLVRSEAIHAISSTIIGESNNAQLLLSVCHRMATVFNAASAEIVKVVSDHKAEFEANWSSNLTQTTGRQNQTEYHWDGSLMQWCWLHQKIGVCTRDNTDPRISEPMHARREQLQLGATVCVPFSDTGGVGRVLRICKHTNQGNFSARDVQFIQTITNQAVSALNRNRLLEHTRRQALRDPLTGLRNRMGFEQSLDSGIYHANANDGSLALALFDLDGFKRINDTFGHSMGDRVLREVASTVQCQLPEHATIGRTGGDEFGIVVCRVAERSEAIDLIQGIVDSLQQPLAIDHLRLQVGISAGISYYPEDTNNVQELFKNADFALYEAKNSGRNQLQVFNQTLGTKFRARLLLEQQLQQALEHEQFELHYQPKVNCRTGRVSGLEALIRWQHPERGLVSPHEFIPVAEDCGLIEPLGDLVLQMACRQVAQWRQSDTLELTVAVNISAVQFESPGIVERILSAIASHDIRAADIELEVTESIFMRDIDSVSSRLAQLRDAGCRIALDDFGTGYSSLQYLAELPVDTLKIDRAFIRQLSTQHAGSARRSLTSTIILMAKSLGLETIAEGVESEHQLQQVRALGCDHIQGFLHSPPVPADAVPGKVAFIHGDLTDSKNDNALPHVA